jgi:hypothetical protein
MLPRHMGRASAKHAPQAPRVGAHDVILTGLDEERDSTDDEMPPLEPLEGAAQLGAARPDIATSRHARIGDKEGEREPLRPAAKRGSAPACNGR